MPNPRLQPLTHWYQPTLLLQIYSTTPPQPRRPQNHLPSCRPINLHYCEHLLLHPPFLPNLTNTLLPIPQRTHSTQRPTSPTATNTFTPYHRPPTTYTHQHSRHRDIDLLYRQRERVAQPMASWHPLYLTAHRSPPTRLPKHMAPTPQTPQPFELSPPTSPYHSSHHQRIYTFHRFYTLLVVTLPPRHACLCSIHRRRTLP